MGSEFIVRLPLVLPMVGQEPKPPHPDGQTGTRKCRVLIVDDLMDNADSLAVLLRMLGHDIRTAYDGEEAVTAAEEFQPQVVLLDIGMPRMNGYETIRRIRREPWGGRICFVAVTGWGKEEDRRRTEEAGFDFHMVKPIDPYELMRVLDSLHTEEGSELISE